MRSLFDETWKLLFFIFLFSFTFFYFFFEGFIWAFEELIWKLRKSALWFVSVFSHLNMKSMSMRKGVILFFSDLSNKLIFVFWMFNSGVLFVSITVVKISPIFVSEVSVIFVRFFDCVDFIVYVFEMIMIFLLIVELMFSMRITKNVLSRYKIWESYLFVIVFITTFLIRSQLRLKTSY